MVKNWALAIGINHYEFLQPLKYAKRDAQLMQKLLCDEAGFERVFLFSDDSPDIGGEPTRPYRNNLVRFLRQLFEHPFMEAGDQFWLYFSGHGMIHANNDYIMPCDGDPNDIENTGISLNYITECLRRCGCENIVLILDANRQQHKHSGEGIGRQTQQIAHQTGAISIFSCSPHESSSEIDALQTGVFTHALLEGLGIQGQCATVKRLFQYLSFRVPKLAQHYNKPRQTPMTIADSVIQSQLILVPKYANLDDIAQQNIQNINTVAVQVNHNLQLAEQLWMGVNNVASSPKITALEDIQRIAHVPVGCGATLSQISVSTASPQDGISSKYQHQSTTAIDEISIDYLSSERGVDYQRLRDLLAERKWKEADRETLAVMLKVAAREKQGWLNIESINQFPYTDLYTIDQLWVKYSNGRFGFSVQKRIWESVGGQPDADYETWCQFCDRLGWRENNSWLFYTDLNFSVNAPVGHFPAAGAVNILTVWRGWVVGLFSCLVGFSALASRLAKCRL